MVDKEGLYSLSNVPIQPVFALKKKNFLCAKFTFQFIYPSYNK